MAITIVAFATNLSALWILLANGWMQNPIGAKLVKIIGNPLITERAEMASFLAVITNPYGWLKFFHTVLSGYTVAAFFVMGIAAFHLLKKNETDLFKRSFRAASIFGLGAGLLVLATGDFHAVEIAKTQPTKLAALEAIWETQPGGTSLSLISIPIVSEERNIEFGKIPQAGSILAFHNPTIPIKGLKEFAPEERPPVAMTFWSFRLMVIIGTVMMFLSLIAVYLSLRNKIGAYPLLLKIYLWSIPLPYLACQLGWIVAEVGRQPWLVYGMLRTADGVSKSINLLQVAGSLAAFTLLYGILGAIGFYLIVKYAAKGPDAIASNIMSHRKEV
jgi:cytochrome d ubiquinol oxidase subunit I